MGVVNTSYFLFYKTKEKKMMTRKAHKQKNSKKKKKKGKTIPQRRYKGGSETKVQAISIFVAGTFLTVFEFIKQYDENSFK